MERKLMLPVGFKLDWTGPGPVPPTHLFDPEHII